MREQLGGLGHLKRKERWMKEIKKYVSSWRAWPPLGRVESFTGDGITVTC